LKSGTWLFLALAAFPAGAQVPATPAPSPLSSPPAAPTAPAAPVSLSLTAALQRALAQNFAIGRSRAEVAAQEAQTRVIVSSILPKIGFQSNYTLNNKEVSFGSSNGQSVVILPRNDWSYRFTLSQPIWAGNRERKAIQQARLQVDLAREGLLDAEDQLLLGVAGDYLTVLSAEQLIAVEQQNLQLSQRRRSQAQVFFEAGETTRVDVLRADADIKVVERRLAAARQQREAAVGRLRLDLALEAPIAVEPPGPFLPKLPAETELAATAEASRPAVIEAKNQLTVAQLEVEKQRNALLPTVTADGAWINQRSAFPASQYGQFSLHLNVPIFDSGEIKGRVAVAREREHQAELALAQVRQQVREEVHQALVDLTTAEASLQLAKEQQTAAEAEYAQASELYRAQELTSLETQTAETSLAEARRTVATSQLDRDVAELRVWAAAGLLKKTVPLEGAQ